MHGAGDRLMCQVPFCQRTSRRKLDCTDDTEWLCGKHYGLVDRRLKMLRAEVRRRRRLGIPLRAYHDAWLWRECKRQAIERALGRCDV